IRDDHVRKGHDDTGSVVKKRTRWTVDQTNRVQETVQYSLLPQDTSPRKNTHQIAEPERHEDKYRGSGLEPSKLPHNNICDRVGDECRNASGAYSNDKRAANENLENLRAVKRT